MIVHWEYYHDDQWCPFTEMEVTTFDQAIAMLQDAKWNADSYPQRLWVEFAPQVSLTTKMVPV